MTTLAKLMIDVHRDLVADFDVVEVLTNLAGRGTKVLGVAATGVMVAGPSGELRLVAASSESAPLLEVLETQSREGPCPECCASGAPVEAVDLAHAIDRWPKFSALALASGFRSVRVLPMRFRGSVIGGVNLLHTDVGVASAVDASMAQAFADLATIAVLQHRLAASASLLHDQLQRALDTRRVIDQATGIVAEQRGVATTEAFLLLRRFAHTSDAHLSDIAVAVVERALDVGGPAVTME